MSLFGHAQRLHHQYPDEPLPRYGEPLPDEARHPRQRWIREPEDRRLIGADVATLLDAYFADPVSTPDELVDAFHDLYPPSCGNEHVTAAALRADRQRVQETGRWLVEHSTDRCSVAIGLALLATDWAKEDIPLIQTIGLLSREFGTLAAYALRRRLTTDALRWLAQRSMDWGRVHAVEELLDLDATAARPWLLRHACGGSPLDGYFAGKLATRAHLHEAIISPEADDDLVDHTGRLLRVMTRCGGMGMTIDHYPPARAVLAAHAGHLGRQAPDLDRYLDAAVIADRLAELPPDGREWIGTDREPILARYLAVLQRDDWSMTLRSMLDPADEYHAWFAGTVAARLRLRAFEGFKASADAEPEQ
ncbi:hypothetical protein AAH979_17615 [Plantactinospora sp. ZYX-F-223]|uniref:hypothetical protein n=1 Tax=Plantactinospora sp. ZYX-F-223 TaxID=3144103 RepID=UPI0031FC27FD